MFYEKKHECWLKSVYEEYMGRFMYFAYGHMERNVWSCTLT